MFTHVLDALLKLAQLTATTAGVYVLLVTGPRELRRWRRTKYDERAAEAAASAMITAHDLITAIGAISTPAQLQGDRKREEGQPWSAYIRAWFGQRLAQLDPQLIAFQRARVEARIYFDDDKCQSLQAIADHYRSLVEAHIEWSTFAELEGLHPKADEAYDRLFSSRARETRDTLEKTVLASFQDAARFHVRA